MGNAKENVEYFSLGEGNGILGRKIHVLKEENEFLRRKIPVLGRKIPVFSKQLVFKFWIYLFPSKKKLEKELFVGV